MAYLNLQTVIQMILSAERSYNYVNLAWVAVLLLYGVIFMATVVLSCRASSSELLIFSFMLVLLFHAGFAARDGGLKSALNSFISWGAPIGLAGYMIRARSIDWRAIVCFILVASALLQSLGLYFQILSEPSYLKIASVGSVIRYYGFSQSVSVVGTQLAVGCIVCLTLWAGHTKKTRFFVLFTIIFSALILVGSRGPLIYFLLVGLMALIFQERRLVRRAIYCTIVALWLILFFVFFYSYLSAYAGDGRSGFILNSLSITDAGNVQRLALYRQAVELAISDFSTFVFGFGAGNFSLLAEIRGEREYGVESSIIKMFLELGLIGFVCCSVIVTRGVRAGLIRTGSYEQTVAGRALAFAMLILTLQMVTHEIVKSWIGLFYFWLIVGGLLASNYQPQIIKSQDAGLVYK